MLVKTTTGYCKECDCIILYAEEERKRNAEKQRRIEEEKRRIEEEEERNRKVKEKMHRLEGERNMKNTETNPSIGELVYYYQCVYGYGADDVTVVNELSQKIKELDKEGIKIFFKKLILEYENAVQTGTYKPWVIEPDSIDALVKYLHFNEFAFINGDDSARSDYVPSEQTPKSLFEYSMISLNKKTEMGATILRGELCEKGINATSFKKVIERYVNKNYGPETRMFVQEVYDTEMKYGEILAGQYNISYIPSNQELWMFFKTAQSNLAPSNVSEDPEKHELVLNEYIKMTKSAAGILK